MVGPMTFTLVAEYFPLERRTSAIGWLSAGLSLSYVIGAPAIGFIAELSGWQLAFLGFVLPISIAGLMLAAKCLPPAPHSRMRTTGGRDYFAGFRAVLSNRSAVACMVGMATALAAYQAFLAYSSSFYRQRFLASTTLASLFVLVSALCFTLGSLVCGRFVNKLGRKTLAVSAAAIGSIFIISHTNLPILWLSLTARFLGSLFMALTNTAIGSLTLEQVPRFRGTMMSINRAVSSVGSALGAGLGGLALLLYDYEFVGISLGIIGLAGAVILQLLAIDPTPREHQG